MLCLLLLFCSFFCLMELPTIYLLLNVHNKTVSIYLKVCIPLAHLTHSHPVSHSYFLLIWTFFPGHWLFKDCLKSHFSLKVTLINTNSLHLDSLTHTKFTSVITSFLFICMLPNSFYKFHKLILVFMEHRHLHDSI